MIKQIQLRGISHRPSDKLTQDGGLEECIDLRLDNQELGPAKDAVNVTDELAPGLSESGIDVMYIHKGNGYTNYIGTKVYTESNTDVTYLVAYVKTSTWSVVQIKKLDAGPVSFTSIGNFVIVNLNNDTTLYALFKEGEYKVYNSINRPHVFFSTTEVTPPEVGFSFSANGIAGVSTSSTAKGFWDATRESGGDAEKAFLDLVVRFMWERIDETRQEQRVTNKAFTAPVLVRYALRLCDGSYIHVSEPIMLFSDYENSAVSKIRANLGYVNSTTQGMIYRFICEMQMKHCFTVQANISLDDVGDWSDIISSVDVFLSTDIFAPKHGTGLGGATEESERTIIDPTLTFNGNDITIDFSSEITELEEFEEELLKKDNFYKVASFQLQELPVSNAEIKPVAQDELVVKPRLPEGQTHTITPIGSCLSAYNMRLVTGEQKVWLAPGCFPHAKAGTAVVFATIYQIVYHVRDSYGAEHIVRGVMGNYNADNIRAYISYPDPKCFQADLYVGAIDPVTHHPVFSSKVILPMNEHPRLNCSYGFWGLDSRLDTPETGDGRSTEAASTIPEASDTYLMNNKLMLSEFENPFVFPLGQRQLFQAPIIAAIPATIALSANQRDPFPIFVFTKDGIWAESITSEGELANASFVSRDVAREGTFAQLDRSIAFVTDRGVMVVGGDGNVECLSPFMDGPQYTIKDIAPAGSALRTSFTADGYGSLLGLSLDTTSFKDFINGCKPLYDYENKRILLFNPNKSFVYECDLDSSTWRKHTLPDTFVRNLNGYPNAYSYLNGKIYDWSVVHNYNEVNPSARKGWVLTRPFDLGAPDIRKSINSIRIRGVYNHADVKYILLGSMNGIQWQRLTSLRGGSYKSFRILILTNFTPGEKLSWIDIDFETRFGNKLR